MRITIKTSESNWFEKAVHCYKEKKPFLFIDDANLGIIEKDLRSAINFIRFANTKGRETWKSIVGVLTGLGIGLSGIYIVGLAIADPEPTSKLGLLVVGGLVMALTGSLGILASLGVVFSVSAKNSLGGIEVTPR